MRASRSILTRRSSTNPCRPGESARRLRPPPGARKGSHGSGRTKALRRLPLRWRGHHGAGRRRNPRQARVRGRRAPDAAPLERRAVHEVHTGLAVLRLPGATERVVEEITRVSFAPLSERRNRSYIATGEPFDKAGAYANPGHRRALRHAHRRLLLQRDGLAARAAVVAHAGVWLVRFTAQRKNGGRMAAALRAI